ncbi:SDR family NAD(P)-dependent oxidoreductase [Saccharospirillum mangrovi]|uniref:SDR family NAD(P)-dependent oxidoreductase n=1 Tax=Saccharospirillum mangrovi TaxID=2161747 RepID=UPI000D3D4DC0|nr:SDR family NAD(P)-dependent oxidoreductase [Saccharospirillum mangrovi]
MTKKLCLITGGSRGLGAELVTQYLADGWTVREFSRSGSGETHIAADFSRRENAIDTIDAQFRAFAAQDWTEIVLIINAAQIGPIGPLSASVPRDWWQSLDVNLTLNISAIGLFQQHFQTMAARKVVAVISSGAAQAGMGGWGLYCLAKSGLERLAEAMAEEQQNQPQPIQTLNISPGLIDTDMQAQIRAADTDQFADVEQFRSYKDSGQLVAPARVAGAVRQLIAGPFRSGELKTVREVLS